MPLFSIRFAVLAALLTASGLAAATQCVYRARTPDARVVRFSGEVLAPEGWTVDQQCERLEVVTGSYRVVAPGAGGKLAETEVLRGTLVKREDGIASGLLRQIGIVLAGDERVRAGMSRASADFDVLAESMPSGRVVDHGVALDIVFPDPVATQGAALHLTTAGRAPLRLPITAGVARMPAAYLRSGADYQWRYVQGDTTLKGSFAVVSEATYADARAGIEAEVGPADPDGMRALAVAERLVERGYTLESRAVLHAYFSK
jgi:hypothetical protein